MISATQTIYGFCKARLSRSSRFASALSSDFQGRMALACPSYRLSIPSAFLMFRLCKRFVALLNVGHDYMR